MPDSEHELDFELLGPLVVRRAGAVLDPGRRKQRLLLIRLLIADGRAVAPETLCEELWPQQTGRAPGKTMASLHAHVSKIRAILEPRRQRGTRTFDVLLTTPSGYALNVAPDSRDTVRFERAVADARRSLGHGRPGHALETVGRAVGMWRGAALADAADHLFAAQEVARLEDLRQTAWEIRTTSLLLNGRITEAVEAARELTVEHPLRETGWALLLRALYLAGRHPEALRCYADLRGHLADELGLEPGPALRALHDGILRHDLPPLLLPDAVTAQEAGPAAPTADSGDPKGATWYEARKQHAVAMVGEARPAGTPHGAPHSSPTEPPGASGAPAVGADEVGLARVTRPAQLPGDLAVFAGRTTEGARLSAVSAASGRPGPAGARVVVIGGAPGIGKTTFAVHHAHRIAPSFPDGQLFVNLCGFHPHAPAVEPGDALHGFLTALGVPAQRIPEDTPARSALFRSLLTGRRVLLVLDNARDEQQVRPLLPAGDGCFTLVTSRNRLPGLIAADGARFLSLPLPSQAEAHETLARRLGAERLAAEPDAARDIVRLCGRLPLALAVVAAAAELDPAFPLHAVADDLRQARGGLDAFTGFDTTTDVRAAFSWSYRSLDPGAARLFRLLALHPGPHITAPAAAGLAGLSLPATRRLLAALTRSCLVEQPQPGRFTLHDLLRDYAGELTHTHDHADERHTATLRVLDHYLFTAHAGNRLLKRDSLPDLDLGSPTAGAVPEDLTTAGQVSRWFAAEHQVLRALLQTAVSHGLDDRVTGLAWSLKEHLNRQEYWPEAIAALAPVLEVAQRLGDRLAEGRYLRHVGSVHGYLGHQEQAVDHLERATVIFEELGTVLDQACAHYAMACALFLFGRVQEALAFSERGLALSRETGNELWVAECLVELAWLRSHTGQPERSLAYSEEAIALFRRLGTPWQEAQGRDVLAHALRLLGRYEEAMATYRRAMTAFDELGDHRNVVGVLMRMGDTRLAMGDREAARADWLRALDDAERQSLLHTAQQVRDRLAALATGEPHGDGHDGSSSLACPSAAEHTSV